MATVGVTHGHRSTGGHQRPGPAPYNFEMAYGSSIPMPSIPHPLSLIILSAALFAAMWSENPRSVSPSSVFNVL